MLDHILRSRNLFQNTAVEHDVVHVNSEFAVQTSDHDPQVVRFRFVEQTPPVTTVSVSPPPDNSGWNNTNVAIRLSATDNPGGSGVSKIVCTRTGAQIGGATLPGGSRTVITITAEGVTTPTYFARDNAGNQETPETPVIRIDK